MPLNKLDNFIKNTEGRILYVNPSDLDSTDSITNEGNSLAQPFKTVQRALLEAARFSYLRGNNNDITEKTTILLFPGEHIIDNRPGYAIYDNSGVAYVTPVEGGVGTPAITTLSLELDTNFDLTQKDNILYKFNSVHGGVIVPRGTSIVGLDLRKTKIRPKYVPNPTDYTIPNSAIFRITGACYFWQFSVFDGRDSETVYTNPRSFDAEYTSSPRFSHHKLTVFEYADGVNTVNREKFSSLTDLDMYYHKVGNAYNVYRSIETASKFPRSELSFAKQTPEWQIVGAFKSDPINVSNIISGNGTTATDRITVTTNVAHELSAGTPIRIRGVGTSQYNISTVVQDIISSTQFTYLLETFPINLNASPRLNNATVTVETDTVGGASPYVFNISLRTVWGMNGMHADGTKASGFRSMVVAQFTAVSLQKDDRAFVKYNPSTRVYDGIDYGVVTGDDLPAQASSTVTEKVYHLDQDAIYRPGWETSHIKASNDSFIQIVSVFAIGFTYHFDINSGADASITNSNSNFGQVALKSSGFKSEAFDKDNHAYITSIVAPRSIDSSIPDQIDWLQIDVPKTRTVGDSTKLFLSGFTSRSSEPTSLVQGYRIGAKSKDVITIDQGASSYSAAVYMTGTNNQLNRNEKSYDVQYISYQNHFYIGSNNLKTGETVIINSSTGDLPENIKEHSVYFAITQDTDVYNAVSNPEGLRSSEFIKLASSYTYAFLGEAVSSYQGSGLTIKSRVSDKNAGDIGSPIQWDTSNNQWYINVKSNNDIYNSFLDSGIGYDPTDDDKYSDSTDLAYVTRIADERALDEKTYKLRVVIPKEAYNAKNPEIGFVLQDSSFTGALTDNDIPGHTSSRTTLPLSNTSYNRNTKFIKTAEKVGSLLKYTTELPHRVKVNDTVIIRNVKDSSETTTGQFNRGYNGSFTVDSLVDEYSFYVSYKDILDIQHDPGTFQNDTTQTRTVSELPTLERNDIKSNLYIYRNDVISDYIYNQKDGIYHLYVLSANNAVPNTFTDSKFTQSPVDLYPQLDRDNYDDNQLSAKTFAKRSPIGDVATNDLKKSITRETCDIFCEEFNLGLKINTVSTTSTTGTLGFLYNHGLGGVNNGSLTAGGSSHTEGVYHNVKLYNDSVQSDWRGATGRVTVNSSGLITEIKISAKGSGYSDSDTLYPDVTVIGGSADSYMTLSTSGITTYIGDVIQLTGDGETADAYYRISSVTKNTVGFARTSEDPTPTTSQYAFVVGPSVKIDSTSFANIVTTINGDTQITVGAITFTTVNSHGLNVGNKFRVISSTNNNAGDYIVKDVTSTTTFTVQTESDLPFSVAGGYVLKHGLSSNEGISDIRTESYSSRTIPFYDGEVFKLTGTYNAGSNAALSFTCLSGANVSDRLRLGDFLQINDEIFRVSGEVTNTSAVVSRGYLGTKQGDHESGTLFKKVRAIPVEFRRPSICRASGHTFEYLGYGPGNYSTALPQVQIKTLSEREDFLVQAQERSAGAVVYTGMNSRGDTFNGNTKVSAASGETVSYDIPKPTVTGQDPSKLSVAFDEITVRERIIVEGGTSGYVLSQFDGPVTMTKNLRVKGKSYFNNQLRVTLAGSSSNPTTGAFVVKGGIGVGDDSHFGGDINVVGDVLLTDNSILGLGTDVNKRLEIYTSPSDSAHYLKSTATDREIRVKTGDAFLVQDTSNNTIIRADVQTKQATLYYGGTEILTTENTGINVTGIATFSEAVVVPSIVFGDNTSSTDKSSISYSSATLYIENNNDSSGDIYIRNSDTDDNATDRFIYINAIDNHNSIECKSNEYVKLYYNGDEKLATTNTGVNVTGTVTASTGFLPNTNAGAYLGTSSLKFSDLYIQGQATIDNIQIDGSTIQNTSSGNITIPKISATSVSTSTLSASSVTSSSVTSSSLSVSSSASIQSLSASGTLTVSGSIVCTGDITAFASDIRLKTNIEPIENALDKVCKLHGFTYNFNEIGQSLGFDGDIVHAGVSAQDVREVLPEVVRSAPANIHGAIENDYITVQYEKLVPLLIEAIKDLNAKVDYLEQKLLDK